MNKVEEVVQALEQRFPAAWGDDHGEAAEPKEVYDGAEIQLQPLEDATGAYGCLEPVNLWEAHAGVGLPAGLVTP
ncbi:hypothetical protein WISP_143699 [Willisornis vidua]|uniref:Uncharacterized protein n=1 Tax=Willisornis vidua TaxID=1566151 RepID=A0ABQ9CLA6_9PASS|nr:hypothetical protein WISP_143699 [Willisornis vidua]